MCYNLTIMRQKISVIGAGNVGAEIARQIAQRELADVVLLDVLEGIPQGKALDMQQSGSVFKFDSIIKGSNDYKDIADSKVVVITAGLARKPGMSREDLLFKNAEIIKSIVTQVKKYAPKSIILIVTNPLDVMVYLAWKVSGFPANRVLGMAPLLDQARMETFVAEELKCSPKKVNAVVLGSHGDLMVPLPRFSTVKGKPLTKVLSKEKIDAIVTRTKNGGAEIVSFLKTGSAYYAPAAAAAKMVEAIINDTKEEIATCAYLKDKDVYIGVICKLGKGGVEEIIHLGLNHEEEKLLNSSIEAVKKNIQELKI